MYCREERGKMRRRRTNRYACQARTVAGGALLSSMVSLGGVGVGMWLLIYSQDFILLLGLPLRDAFAGYSIFAAYMTITGIMGACVSLLKSTIGLLCFTVLLISNLVCQGAIFTYLFLEMKQVARKMESTITHSTDCRTFVTLQYKFSCDLTTTEQIDNQCTLNPEGSAVELCSDDVIDWLQRGVWSALGVSAIMWAFQLLLSITSLMLRHMIHEISDYSSSSGSCLSRNHSKTAPTLVNVTPAPVPIPYTSPHEAWSLENNPFMQGFNNHNVPRLAPPVTTTTAIATHSQRRRHDEQRTRHLNFESTQL